MMEQSMSPILWRLDNSIQATGCSLSFPKKVSRRAVFFLSTLWFQSADPSSLSTTEPHTSEILADLCLSEWTEVWVLVCYTGEKQNGYVIKLGTLFAKKLKPSFLFGSFEEQQEN